MTLSKPSREALRQKFGGNCAYCGCSLIDKKWHADHVKPVNRVMKYARDVRGYGVMVPTGELYNPENDHEGNLVPACCACNIDKSSYSLEEWRKQLQELTDTMRRNIPNFRHAERFGRVVSHNHPVVFWFETYELQKEGAA